VDLQVPANSEYILEGYVVPGELSPEGPFGDHTGYYSLQDDYPVFHVTAITQREDPIYPQLLSDAHLQKTISWEKPLRDLCCQLSN